MNQRLTPLPVLLGLALVAGSYGVSAQERMNPYTPQEATNRDWWPEQLDLSILHHNSPMGNPLGSDFDYPAEFGKIDLDVLKQDLASLLTTSQDWWPADWGTYGPLFIRMAWHSAGTYRVGDGRGGASDGTQRFAPLNSWPDNANLDKARRLLWPIKQKYGQSISWADLMVLAGNVALESSGFETFGFAGGRADVWEPQNDIFWGPEGEWLGDDRHTGDRELLKPLAAVQMGLIYVNPEGPNGKPDPLAAARDIREAFARMAMGDEETVALIAGGHTLGKTHGAAKPDGNVGPDPEGAGLEDQGLGWKNSHGTGKGADTITSGLEGAWTATPTKWSNGFLANLYSFEWELTKSPAGAHQWTPIGGAAIVPDAHIAGKYNNPVMLTTDMALRMDPIYGEISRRFFENPDQFNAAFASAWYKLTHRDMGPVTRLLGKDLPEAQLWQDPVPAVSYELLSAAELSELKSSILNSGLSVSQLVSTAWASAGSYRDSDKRGGANGARLRLAPQNAWAVNEPTKLASALGVLESVHAEFNAKLPEGKQVSLADVIVLGGSAAIEVAAKEAGYEVTVGFALGRADTTQEWTDTDSFDVLEPLSDGFRNYHSSASYFRSERALVDRANQLALSAPEMTALVGGLRVLGANYEGSSHGVFTGRPGVLSNDFFVNLLDMNTEWKKSESDQGNYTGFDRASGQEKYSATSVDLLFGSNSQLRAISEVYASSDGQQKLVNDFATAWTKV
ncbi:MAG: catalase-peroxidase, partial [Gammaproteobacteria bacterium]